MPRAWVLGDNVSTDDIIPGRYLVKRGARELGKHALENLLPDFPSRVKRGDVLIAGRNFGCGSSREQAPLALKGVGVGAVIAESFARIFFRNAVNQGLPVMICRGVRASFSTGEEVEYDLGKGVVRNLTRGLELKAEPLPEFMLSILRAGGLIPYLKAKKSSSRSQGE
jgi:3-isopropylmalate/(R)-2-methylmalate dehydratase small subunit